MKHLTIAMLVSLFLYVGCGAPVSAPVPNSGPSVDEVTDDDQWFDGNGDPVDDGDVFLGVDGFTLVATTVGGGTVDPASGTFAGGEEITLTATADGGWSFDHWEGDISGADAVVTITIEANTTVSAWFVADSDPIDPGPIPDPGDEDGGDGDGDGDGDNSSIDPGSDFTSAPKLDLGTTDRAVVDDNLAAATDVHVYDVGALAEGDRLTITCEAAGQSQLDPLIALFDASGYRVFWNDDVNLSGGNYDSAIDDLIRHASTSYYIAVTSSSYEPTTGDYTLTVDVERGAGTAEINNQTIVIDLDGAASVVVAGQNWGSIPVFDAELVGAAFAGQTDEMVQAIVAVIRADYAAYDMTVLTTSDPTPTGPYTTVYLGGDSNTLFGIADDINFYNSNQSDNCIVFAQAFAGLSNDLSAMSQAIGNVISHEVGHDLGLMHTTDVTTLMDTTGTADTLLVDQAFGTATVFDFPIGFQNAPLLLEESLGLTARPRVTVEDGYLRCGTCGAKLYKLSEHNAGHAACGTTP